MSNVLIIKHGSLGDLIQANGAMEDIKNTFKDSKVFLLTTGPYIDLMSHCPYLDSVIMDKRLPRWNLFYLLKLKKLLSKFNFTHVFDLQNSSRTKFYQKYLLNKSKWSNTESSLETGQNKKDFEKEPVLERMKIQLEKSGVIPKKTNSIDLSWSLINLNRFIRQYTNNDYILIFPFCSKKHRKKKWPYFRSLVNQIKERYENKYSVLIAPGPDEIKNSSNFNAKVVLDNGKSVNLQTLISLISNSKFIISNDTGPAHIASHLDKKGLVLFGSHTSPKKVSIENTNFKAITVKNLNDLTADNVMQKITNFLD